MSARKAANPKKTVDAVPSSRSRVVRVAGAEEPVKAAIGPGAHFAKLFQKLASGRYEADLMAGGRVEVGIAPEVDEELADECLAGQEIVLVGLLGTEVVVFGALRTKAKPSEVVVVEAPKKLVLRAGKAKLELSADGKVRVSGNEMTIDAPREVRIASAHVEIP